MRSEQHHIDDFFRKKEEEYQQDTGNADIHWEQMRGLLQPATVPPAPGPKGYRLLSTRHIIKYLGGFAVVTVITFVALTTLRSKKKPSAPKALAQKTAIAPPRKQSPADTTILGTAPQTRPVRVKATGKAATIPKTVTPVNPVRHPIGLPQHEKTERSNPTRIYQPANQEPSTTERSNPTRVYQPANTAPATIEPINSTFRIERPQEEANFGSIITITSREAQDRINSFYNQLDKPVNRFSIPPDHDTVLVGKEGTRLVIPAFAFANKKGVVSNDAVTIVLREYYSYDDIIAAKLSTTSGGEQLISGGMVQITATVNGENARLAAGQSIKLQMPTTKVDEQMQLFRGTRSSLQNASIAKFLDNRMIDTVHYLKRIADEKGDIDWIPEGQVQKFSDPLNRRILVFDPYGDPYHVERHRRVKAWFYVSKNCPLSNAEMKAKLIAHSNGYFDVIKIKRIQVVPMARYRIRAERLSIAGDSVEMTFREALKKKLLTPEDSIRVAERLRMDSITLEKRHQLMDKYNFTITNLGWFNCDKFNNQGPKVLFAFKPGAGFDAGSMVSHVVFTRYKSVMAGAYNGNTISFGRVPKGETVKIVCIGIKNGKVMSCIQELNTDKEEIGNLAFEETTPEYFRQKLQTLNLSLP
jgi:hypothetical protein